MGKGNKINPVSKKTRDLTEKVNEQVRLLEEAQKEDKAILEEVEKQIKDICTKAGVFCGMVLGPKEISAINELMHESHENVSVEFRIYFKDKEE